MEPATYRRRYRVYSRAFDEFLARAPTATIEEYVELESRVIEAEERLDG